MGSLAVLGRIVSSSIEYMPLHSKGLESEKRKAKKSKTEREQNHGIAMLLLCMREEPVILFFTGPQADDGISNTRALEAKYKTKNRFGRYLGAKFSTDSQFNNLRNSGWPRCVPDHVGGRFQAFLPLLIYFDSHGFTAVLYSLPPHQTLTILHCVVLYFTVLNYTYTGRLASRLARRNWNFFFFFFW
jgi:hypothetical protein